MKMPLCAFRILAHNHADKAKAGTHNSGVVAFTESAEDNKVADQQKNCRHSDGHNGVGTDLKDIFDGFKSHYKKHRVL